ncbi:TIGR01777 family oxidoreductase [Oceanobacillus saliphilus]|uniref:TIGR01777 family oxidoreductase n=1 Tax=Oceanobacillus saliphilus TaxID=2925834 RepID=UPI00201D30BA|nr:TIGR01777 family oxidoreductase [Oceanobacillus saliphilus]
MNFLISGGSGFIGKHLSKSLHEKGNHTYILTRSANNKTNTINTTYIPYNYPSDRLPIIDGVINLAGESLFGYWSSKKKDDIIKSRLDATNQIIELIKNMKTKPKVFISGSAVGYYGTSEDLIYTEATTKPGKDFLAEVTVKWEEAARQAESMGIRTIYARFGIVLGNEGSLPLMSIPVKMLTGGKIGNGEQWMSWIHIQDAVNLIEYCLFEPQLEGPVNFTAPKPKRNKEFMKILSKNLKRPYWFRTPSTLIHATIGEMGQLITKGQYVLPQKALEQGFEFNYPELNDALKQLADAKKTKTLS